MESRTYMKRLDKAVKNNRAFVRTTLWGRKRISNINPLTGLISVPILKNGYSTVTYRIADVQIDIVASGL